MQDYMNLRLIAKFHKLEKYVMFLDLRIMPIMGGGGGTDPREYYAKPNTFKKVCLIILLFDVVFGKPRTSNYFVQV
jgi:hypothetical protein